MGLSERAAQENPEQHKKPSLCMAERRLQVQSDPCNITTAS
jgi:hypothetical protein